MPAGVMFESQGLLGKDHQVRVFVSSTFRDAHAERDWLDKCVFLQLRLPCEPHGGARSEVGLHPGGKR
jgi:hypothetical protein